MKPLTIMVIASICAAAVVTSISLAQHAPAAGAATAPAALLSTTRTSTSTHSGQHHSSGVSSQPPQGTAILTPSPMPRDFDLLSERNIFIKGRQLTDATDITDKTVHPGPVAGTPDEANMVFSGAIITQDQGVAAFIEDTAAGKVNLLHVGDPIAQGKITSITLDYLEYESNGKASRVAVGQNLLGGNPIATSQPAGDTGTPSNDILERMRQRRLQESGGR